MRIIFFGTPAFAVASLNKIAEAGFDIAAVVTSPDKPAGRGLKMQESAVKEAAVQKNIRVLQPANLKNPAFQQTLRDYHADLFVIIAFRMLPEAVWDMPRLGSINLHASLLPDYRGAAPINHAIINGEQETGLTTFFLKHEIDTGDVIMKEKVQIGPIENAGELHDRLMDKGALMMVETLQRIASGNYHTVPQEASPSTKIAPKLSKEFCRINWDHSCQEIFNKIRGLSPYPAAWTTINGAQLKIYTCSFEITGNPETGKLLSDHKSFLKIGTNDGFILPEEVQLEGKKKMRTDEFLRGYKMEDVLIA